MYVHSIFQDAPIRKSIFIHVKIQFDFNVWKTELDLCEI